MTSTTVDIWNKIVGELFVRKSAFGDIYFALLPLCIKMALLFLKCFWVACTKTIQHEWLHEAAKNKEDTHNAFCVILSKVIFIMAKCIPTKLFF